MLMQHPCTVELQGKLVPGTVFEQCPHSATSSRVACTSRPTSTTSYECLSIPFISRTLFSITVFQQPTSSNRRRIILRRRPRPGSAPPSDRLVLDEHLPQARVAAEYSADVLDRAQAVGCLERPARGTGTERVGMRLPSPLWQPYMAIPHRPGLGRGPEGRDGAALT